jgi:hypothetical protein
MRSLSLPLALGLATFATGSPLLAQARSGGAGTVFTRPAAESADGFTMIGGVRELSSGKVLVSDPMERSVQLVDLTAGTAVKVGREGQGPGEYSFPGELLPLPADTTLLVDRMNRRFLFILPNGKTGESLAYPADLGLGVDPRFVDGAGRIYFQGSLLPAGGRLEGSVTTPDSVPLLRWDRRSRLDTVAFLKVPAMNLHTSGGSGARMVMMRSQPFSPEDAWAVARDGRLAVARVADYHIDWFSPSKQKTSGPANRFERLRVNEADKEAQRRAMRNPRVFVSGGAGGGSRAAPPPPADMPEPEYPEFKPPFPGRSAWVAPDGNLWLLRSRLGGDPVPTLDVFDARGNLVGKVTIPRDRRVVGFGANSVYMAKTDGDDLQWLERYELAR